MYKVASDDEVKEAIHNVIRKYGMVSSQYKLKDLVQKELSNIDPEYRVSEGRLRALALQTDFIAVEMHCRESNIKKAIGRCPVCGGKLKRLRNLTIFEGIVTIGYACTSCPYWSGLKRRIPAQYIFYHIRRGAKR